MTTKSTLPVRANPITTLRTIPSVVTKRHPWSNALGAFIRTKRIELGISSSSLACLANLRRPYVCHVEGGFIQRPGEENLRKIAIVLEVPYQSLHDLMMKATTVGASDVA